MRSRPLLALTALATLLVATQVPLAAAADGAASTDSACADAPSDRYLDVDGVHARAIDCIGWWGITQGVGDGRYDPSGEVTRQQMATFVRNTIEVSGGALPANAPPAFVDVAGGTHAAAIDQLAAAGIIGGVGDDRYAPGRLVNRGQMASFLDGAWTYRTGEQLPDGSVTFDDVVGTTHGLPIERIAAAGLGAGVGDGLFAPAATVTRQQMATFLARWLAKLVEDGATDYPPAAPIPLPELPASNCPSAAELEQAFLDDEGPVSDALVLGDGISDVECAGAWAKARTNPPPMTVDSAIVYFRIDGPSPELVTGGTAVFCEDVGIPPGDPARVLCEF